MYFPKFKAEGLNVDVSLLKFIFCFVSMVIIVTKVSTTTSIEKAAAPLTAMPIFFSESHLESQITWPSIDKAIVTGLLMIAQGENYGPQL